MSASRVEVTADVRAPAKVVYDVLSDYATHHPRILPKPEFESIVVESGGRGAGTVIRVTMRVMGARSTARMTVDEPEAGRVLRETLDDGTVTTFTVEPAGAGSRVTIATAWPPKGGFRGWVERRVNPMVARRLYARELAILDEYARSLDGRAGSLKGP